MYILPVYYDVTSPPKSFETEGQPDSIENYQQAVLSITYQLNVSSQLIMGKSSKDKRDAYYRLAKEQNWRARSAFKLIQIDEIFDLFAHSQPEAVTRVVDLCAAPGSWSQVLSRVLIKGESFGRRTWEERRKREQNSIARQFGDNHIAAPDNDPDVEPDEDKTLKPRANVKIVAIDLQPMTPLEGIVTLEADITHPSTVPLLLNALDLPVKTDKSADINPESRSVDLVLSDGAPDVTGLHDLDIYIQSQLLYAALNLAIRILRQGGKFVAKIFRGRNVDLLYAQLKTVFERVSVAKPRSSRASSLEAFVVCEGFMPPLDPSLTFPLASQATQTATLDAEIDIDADAQIRWIPPFIACGDLSSWDSDANYTLPPDHVSLDPVQPPTAPAYKKALEQRRAEGGALGKTKK